MASWSSRSHNAQDRRNRPAPRCYCPNCGVATGRGWRPRLCTKPECTEPLPESLRDFRKRLKGSGE